MTVNAVPCTVPVVNNISEMIAALKKHPNFGKGPKHWIEAWGYDESELAEHRTPTAEDLDKASTNSPSTFCARTPLRNMQHAGAEDRWHHQRKVREIAATGAHYNERGIIAVSDMMVFTRPYEAPGKKTSL